MRISTLDSIYENESDNDHGCHDRELRREEILQEGLGNEHSVQLQLVLHRPAEVGAKETPPHRNVKLMSLRRGEEVEHGATIAMATRGKQMLARSHAGNKDINILSFMSGSSILQLTSICGIDIGHNEGLIRKVAENYRGINSDLGKKVTCCMLIWEGQSGVTQSTISMNYIFWNIQGLGSVLN